MEAFYDKNLYEDVTKMLITDCAGCCALCCFALYFSKMDGFPADKESGTPCRNLAPDFRCSVHQDLAVRGYHGCTAFDCLGAGQRMTQNIWKGEHWRDSPDAARQMCRLFPFFLRCHQMLWYLTEAASLRPAKPLLSSVDSMIAETLLLSEGTPEEILLREESGRFQANKTAVDRLLKEAIALVARDVTHRDSAKGQPRLTKPLPKDLIGKNLRGKNLDGQDFSMSLLIATDLSSCSLRGVSFLGADLRDANLSNADLTESIFLTPEQLFAARLNAETKLPPRLAALVSPSSLSLKNPR